MITSLFRSGNPLQSVENSKSPAADVIEIDDEDSVVLIQSNYNLSDVCEYLI